jgi:phosphoglycolate phosphatase
VHAIIKNAPPALALFDIDGTLLRRSGPHHRAALVDAIHRTTGLETTTEGIPLQGMLDPEIIAAMLRRAGAPDAMIREAMPVIQRRAQAQYVRTCPNLEHKTCPGVRRLLGRLERRGVLMALVTGNLTRIGWRKMERAGLKDYFRYGAFGEMAKDRAGLARMAIRCARESGLISRSTPITLIGDSPSDILAARANRVRSIAVSTGICTPDELRAHEPDLLLEDLRALTPEMLA